MLDHLRSAGLPERRRESTWYLLVVLLWCDTSPSLWLLSVKSNTDITHPCRSWPQNWCRCSLHCRWNYCRSFWWVGRSVVWFRRLGGCAKGYLCVHFQRLSGNLKSWCTASSATLCTALWCYVGWIFGQHILFCCGNRPVLSSVTGQLCGRCAEWWLWPGSCLGVTEGWYCASYCSRTVYLSWESWWWLLWSSHLVLVSPPTLLWSEAVGSLLKAQGRIWTALQSGCLRQKLYHFLTDVMISCLTNGGCVHIQASLCLLYVCFYCQWWSVEDLCEVLCLASCKQSALLKCS